jgi:hypothetical protein
MTDAVISARVQLVDEAVAILVHADADTRSSGCMPKCCLKALFVNILLELLATKIRNNTLTTEWTPGEI